MGSRDVWSNSETTTAVKNAGTGGSAGAKPAGSSGILLLGAIVMAAVILSACVLILGLIAGALIYQQSHVSATGDEGGSVPDGTLASPTIIVRPASPADMIDKARLVMNDVIVGAWESEEHGYAGNEHLVTFPFYMVVYNDGTYLIYDRRNDTYIPGTWVRVEADRVGYSYAAVEAGRAPIGIEGSVDVLYYRYDPSDPGKYVFYRRVLNP